LSFSRNGASPNKNVTIQGRRASVETPSGGARLHHILDQRGVGTKLTLVVTRKESVSGGEIMERGNIAHRDAAKSNRRQLATEEGRKQVRVGKNREDGMKTIKETNEARQREKFDHRHERENGEKRKNGDK